MFISLLFLSFSNVSKNATFCFDYENTGRPIVAVHNCYFVVGVSTINQCCFVIGTPINTCIIQQRFTGASLFLRVVVKTESQYTKR